MGCGIGNGINLPRLLWHSPHSMIDCFAYNLICNRLQHIWNSEDTCAICVQLSFSFLNVYKKTKQNKKTTNSSFSNCETLNRNPVFSWINLVKVVSRFLVISWPQVLQVAASSECRQIISRFTRTSLLSVSVDLQLICVKNVTKRDERTLKTLECPEI